MAEWPVASLMPTGIVDADAWEAAGHYPDLYAFLLRARGEIAPLETSLIRVQPTFLLPVVHVPDIRAFL